jgi:predicted enzyme related to lactoylglutathione lyase
MAAPIVHLEFRSFDFPRTSAFYAKVFDWQTQQNATSTYMKLDADNGPSAGWVRADMSQAPGPLAYVVVDDLATTLAEVEGAGGRILVPKLAFAGGGEVALFADPDGNVVGIWMRKDRGASGPATGTGTAPVTATPAAKAPAAAPAAGKPGAVKTTEAKSETKSELKSDKKPKAPAKKR